MHAVHIGYFILFYLPVYIALLAVHTQGRRPGAEFGGTEKIFADQDFWVTIYFPEKMSIFTPKISDDLFLVIDLVFQIFLFYCNKMSYTTLSTQKNHFFKKEFLDNTIFYS